MKISAVSPAKNYTHFNNSFPKSKMSKNSTYTYDFIDEKKLIKTTGTLAFATITAAAFLVMKRNNTTPMKEAAKVVKNINKAIKEFNDPPIDKILKGKRDAEAVKKYNQYMAQKKLDSLNKRLLDGEFSNKPQRVFDALKRNEIKLAHKTGNASNFIR